MPIPKGTDVFANDQGEIIWVEASQAKATASAEQQQLYHDFAIRRGTMIGCPTSFNQLSVGWYVNEPAADGKPNLEIGKDFAMIANRNIGAGEELTIYYASFSK